MLMNIYIKEWYGRLGNNITQLLNAISIGLYYNYNIILPSHKYFKQTYIIINNKITICNDVITSNSNFFRKNRITNFTIPMRHFI